MDKAKNAPVRIRDYGDKSVCGVALGKPVRHATLGAEIEVLPRSVRESEEDFARRLYETAPEQFKTGEFVLKQDGSLMKYGVQHGDTWYPCAGLEVVTGVMTVEFASSYDWARMFRKLGRVCFKVSPDMDVGLHIHADKRWGRTDLESVSPTLGLVLTYMVDTMPYEEILRVFGRVSDQYAEKSERFYPPSRRSNLSGSFGRVWLPELSPAQLRDSRYLEAFQNGNRERNRLVNLLNPGTVEFRGFLTPGGVDEFTKSIALVTALMDFASEWTYGFDSEGRDQRVPTWEYFLELNPSFRK